MTQPVTRIRPASRWVPLDVRELVAFRELAWRLVRRDVTVRYRQTVLGVVWVVLQPLLTAGVFTLVFNRFVGLPSSGDVPYFLVAFWGSTAFTAFSQCVLRAAQSLVANAPLVEKVYFPRLLLPLSATGSVALDTLVAGALGIALQAAYGTGWRWSLAVLPLCLLTAVLLGLAVGVLCAPLIVRYRDVGYVLPLVTQLLLYVSPVGYTAASVPADFRDLYLTNPVASVIEATRWAALGTTAPATGPLVLGLAAGAALLVVATLLFRRQEQGLADVI